MNRFQGYDKADIALELCNWGFSVIPLHSSHDVDSDGNPQDKKPRIFWKKFITEKPTEDKVVQWWNGWPDANIGIVCGPISGIIVVDCDNPEADQWLHDNAIVSPMRVKTQRGYHYYYRCGDTIPQWLIDEREAHKRKNDGVDIQLEGQYVVAPGSVRQSGFVYELEEECPIELDWLPEFALLDKKQLQIDLSNVDAREFSNIPVGGRNDTITKIVGRLVAQGKNYNEVLTEAFEINAEQCNPQLPKGEIVTIVKSIFRTHERNHPQKNSEISSSTNPAATDMTGLRIADPSKDPDPDDVPWPEELLYPSGTMEDIMNYIISSSVKTERLFALGGAIAIMGSVLGQRILSPTGLITNMYVINVGYSSSGKDAPLNGVSNIIRACANQDSSIENLLIGDDIASPSALMKRLVQPEKRRGIITIDEIGHFFQEVKNKNSVQHGLLPLLTKLYSSYNRGMKKIYADTSNDIVIPWHAVSLLGATVPNELWNGIGISEAINGFLARCLVFAAPPSERSSTFGAINTDVPSSIVSSICHLWQITQDTVAEKDTQKRPQPKRLKFDREAEATFLAYKRDTEQKIYAHEKKSELVHASILGRSAAKVQQIAMLHAASQKGEYLLQDGVSADNVEYAINLTKELDKRLIAHVMINVSENPFDEARKKIYNVIRRESYRLSKQGKPTPVSRRTIMRASKMSLKATQDVLDKLVAEDVIRLQEGEKASTGRPGSQCYVAVEDDERVLSPVSPEKK